MRSFSYSSDETDDDKNPTLVKRKKPVVHSVRRQTLENPMPPPAPLSNDSDFIHIAKSKGKTLNSEFREPASTEFVTNQIDTSSSLANRTSKTVQKKLSKNYKTKQVDEDLETGSDSDFIEETEKTYSKSIPVNKLYNSRLYEQQTPLDDEFSKPHEPKPRSIHTMKDYKHIEPSYKSNSITLKDDLHDQNHMDSTSDLLANYESPFLSDFTRRLSSQSSFNLPSTLSRSNLRSERFLKLLILVFVFH